MRSSDGCSARQSMYSAKASPVTNRSCEYFIGCPGFGPQVGVGPVADRLLVLLGDAEQHADHPHRHLGTEVAR